MSTSFGQTFFISLFLLHFEEAFRIGKSEFGLVYGAATLLSALLLPVAGARLDEADLRRYTAATLSGLALSAVMVALAVNVWMLAAGLLGLRLLGQGILGHISQTVMAREFSLNRGKALGVAGIGYPLGEALLPIACAVTLHFVAWRGLWLLVGLISIAVLLPVALRLLPKATAPVEDMEKVEAGVEDGWQRRDLWRDRRMYFILPSVLVLPFVLTGLFLYQAALAQSKGWAIEWIAAAFSVFAVVRALTSLAIGPVIDRYSATRLLPLYMLPLGAGLVVVIVGSTPLTAFAYMVLAGISAGSSGSVASAVWAELYGAANVGRARGFAASFAVFATAASPALMGWMFSAGVRIEQMLAGAAWMILAVGVVSLPVSPLVQDVRVRMKDPLSVARRLFPRGISPGFD